MVLVANWIIVPHKERAAPPDASAHVHFTVAHGPLSSGLNAVAGDERGTFTSGSLQSATMRCGALSRRGTERTALEAYQAEGRFLRVAATAGSHPSARSTSPADANPRIPPAFNTLADANPKIPSARGGPVVRTRKSRPSTTRPPCIPANPVHSRPTGGRDWRVCTDPAHLPPRRSGKTPGRIDYPPEKYVHTRKSLPPSPARWTGSTGMHRFGGRDFRECTIDPSGAGGIDGCAPAGMPRAGGIRGFVRLVWSARRDLRDCADGPA